MHVANTVGGVNRTNFWYGDADKIYDPVQPDQQRKAVAFLVEHGFKTPQALIAPDSSSSCNATVTPERRTASTRDRCWCERLRCATNGFL